MQADRITAALALAALASAAHADFTFQVPSDDYNPEVDPRFVVRRVDVQSTASANGTEIDMTTSLLRSSSFLADGNLIWSHLKDTQAYVLFSSDAPFLVNDVTLSIPDARLVNTGPSSMNASSSVKFKASIIDVGKSPVYSAPDTVSTVIGGIGNLNAGDNNVLFGGGYKDFSATADSGQANFVYAPFVTYALALTMTTEFVESGSAGFTVGYTVEAGGSGLHAPISITVSTTPLPEPATSSAFGLGAGLLWLRARRRLASQAQG